MNIDELRVSWKREEDAAHIHGWDFSHIHDRYTEEHDLPWDYEAIVRSYLRDDTELLDIDTGGGEFLLSLNHPHTRTSATEGYPPNVILCRETLVPLGIHFAECDNAANIPFRDGAFDLVINRHGDYDAAETWRLLRPGGLFVTEQVGGANDADLVEMVLPGTPQPYPHLYLDKQRREFEAAGFEIIQAEEAYRPIVFYDVGAFVWFARIMEWEFPGFSVDRCFDQLLTMQQMIERDGEVAGTIHRFLIVAKK
ncbi:class I SAM-dependent methyltransferase [Actinobaculum sp. 313]|uniref:class I SAM-dependent methyltransferase n=1 Tax=Actinobaculum sp. 313 TaxID=2495645 RepID=UPI000D52603E|nr:class I SAM-dependent methyltransferase [Actinobaculum sp. 313]AWE42096.1 SAM-dependent methyltransferase [Actinobaculum sp. 313]